MSIKRIDVGSRMSGAVIHGNTVYLAGQVGEGESVTDQCKSSLAEVDRLLAASGSSKSKILQTIIYLSDIADFAEMNAVWELDRSSQPAGPRHQRSQARCAEIQGRVHHYRGPRLRSYHSDCLKPVSTARAHRLLFVRFRRACVSV